MNNFILLNDSLINLDQVRKISYCTMNGDSSVYVTYISGTVDTFTNIDFQSLCSELAKEELL